MPPRRNKKLPVWLTPEEADRLLAAARTERDRVLLLVGLYLGLRVSEICALRVERIDFTRSQVLIYQGKGGKDRLLPLPAKLAGALRAWIGTGSDGWVFPSRQNLDRPLTARAVQCMVRRTARRAGITRPDPSQTISPHKLRHTFGSRLAAKGADVVAIRDLMGHSSIAVSSIYLHTNLDRLRDALDRL